MHICTVSNAGNLCYCTIEMCRCIQFLSLSTLNQYGDFFFAKRCMTTCGDRNELHVCDRQTPLLERAVDGQVKCSNRRGGPSALEHRRSGIGTEMSLCDVTERSCRKLFC